MPQALKEKKPQVAPRQSGKSPVILQVLPELRSGGVERGTIEIAAALQRAGWTSIVASEGGPLEKQLAYVGAQHVKLPLATKNPFRMRENIGYLVDTLRQLQVDIIHARSRAPAWSAYYAARRTKTPFVTTFHGFYGIENSFKHWYNSVMARGDRVIAVSNFTASHIQEHYKAKEEKIRVIHRGVDLSVFDPSTVSPHRMAQITQKWRLPDHLPLILMPGRLTRWKGHEFLLRALAKLPHRNFFCVMVGDDTHHESYRQNLEKLITDLELEGHARVEQNISDIAAAYMLAHVVVSASIEPEAFGRIAIEAQAMGKPVIATDHGGARETVLPGVTGWLVPPLNVEALAAALDEALHLDEQTRLVAGENAIWHVRENFSSAIMGQKTLDVYRELLAEKQAKAAAKP